MLATPLASRRRDLRATRAQKANLVHCELITVPLPRRLRHRHDSPGCTWVAANLPQALWKVATKEIQRLTEDHIRAREVAHRLCQKFATPICWKRSDPCALIWNHCPKTVAALAISASVACSWDLGWLLFPRTILEVHTGVPPRLLLGADGSANSLSDIFAAHPSPFSKSTRELPSHPHC